MNMLHAYNESAYCLDRYQSMASAQKILSLKPKFLDTETTGLNDAFLVEICVLSHHGSPMINTLIKPPIPIPPETTRIHGITNEMVADAPEFPLVYTRLKEILEAGITVIYNSSFDCSILENCCEHYGLPPIKIKPKCAMLLYAKYYGEFSSYWGNFKWQKLPGGGKHRAFDDTKACYDLMHLMAIPESCKIKPLERKFPPIQVFCKWDEWLVIEIYKKKNCMYRTFSKFKIKKPAFYLKDFNQHLANDSECDPDGIPF